ncbi:MAG: inorganic phosphate transporter [Dehalococcoidales bacterium]|nr:inorganic phosphate transporter [Dehalococcoidales bacterium]
MTVELGIVLFLCLAAEFTNGLTDAPNAIATVVATRVLSPVKAVLMAGVLNILGVLITGTAVAVTIGTGIIDPNVIDLTTVAAALLTIIVWTMAAWYFGIPTSETHEMLAGLAGAGFAAAGTSALLWAGWQKVLIGLGLSTVMGFTVGYGVMLAIYWLFRRVRYATIRSVFGRLQILSAAFMAFSHGSNDGQKFMGIFALALTLGGVFSEFHVPLWVILLCGVTMGIGTSVGGWRIIKTMGFKMTRLESVQGFAAETSAGAAILVASSLGVPLSTTHTINTAIMGVGSTKRFSAVRWGVTAQIVMTWLITFPACAILGYIFAIILKPLF